MRVITSTDWVNPDGTECSLTVSTKDGEPLSEEDQAFIRRFLPLASELVIEATTSEDDDNAE